MKTLVSVLGLFIALNFAAPEAMAQQPTATLQQLQGYYIVYPGQKVNCNTEYLGHVTCPKVVKSLRADHMISTLIEAAEKKNWKGNNYALIVTEANISEADVVILKCE